MIENEEIKSCIHEAITTDVVEEMSISMQPKRVRQSLARNDILELKPHPLYSILARFRVQKMGIFLLSIVTGQFLATSLCLT